MVEAWPDCMMGRPGYRVRYLDGYTFWIPEASFRAAFMSVGQDPRKSIREITNLFSAEKLSKFGLEPVTSIDLKLKCKKCGLSWAPELTANQALREGYLKCPNGCNDGRRHYRS